MKSTKFYFIKCTFYTYKNNKWFFYSYLNLKTFEFKYRFKIFNCYVKNKNVLKRFINL